MRIGLDLDGCVYNFTAAHRDYLLDERPEFVASDLPDPGQWSTWESWPISRVEWQQSFDRGVSEGRIFAGGLDYAYPGAIEAVQGLVWKGHTVHIVTHRPVGAHAATAQWLADVHLPHESLTFSGDKTVVPVDVMIEDNVDNALAVVDAGGRCILVDRPWNRTWRVEGAGVVTVDKLIQVAVGDIVRCGSWDEVCAEVQRRSDGHGRAAALKIAGYAPTSSLLSAVTSPLSVIADDTTNPKDRIGITKPRLGLVPKSFVIRVAQAMADGARKYGPFNWRTKRVSATVYHDAALRHLASWFDGEDDAADSGAPHLAHAAACIGILIDAGDTGNLIDDRPTPGAAARLIAELTEVPA